MKLLTKGLEERFSKLGCQDGKGDSAIIIAKFFTPWTNWTWWATEFMPEENLFFGLVQGLEVELGYFSLEELQSIRGVGGLGIERDLHWRECMIGEIRSRLTQLR